MKQKEYDDPNIEINSRIDFDEEGNWIAAALEKEYKNLNNPLDIIKYQFDKIKLKSIFKALQNKP